MSEKVFLIGNIAASLDGKTSLPDSGRYNISCEDDFILRDCIRSCVGGIIIGGGTLTADNPSLLVKDPALVEQRYKNGYSEQPAGIAICGRHGPPENSRFFNKSTSRRILITGHNFQGAYDNTEIYRSESERPDLEKSMELLFSLGIKTAMVEGGGTLFFSLLKAGLLKEFYVSLHPIIIGGSDTPTFFDGEGFTENQVKQIVITEKYPLSDGGVTLHCTVAGETPKTTYKNKKFTISVR